MKSTGMVRNIDELGRIVLPKELRSIFDIKEKDSLEIFVDENNIILKKYEPGCLVCGEVKELRRIKEKNICTDCIVFISKIV